MEHADEEFAVNIKRLEKSFGKGKKSRRVLKGISLKIAKHQIFGLLGPNGAGKTTLIYILSGLLRADSGSISVLGLNPETQREALAASTNICSGNSMFIYSFTPREILKYYGLLYGMDEKRITLNSERLIRELGITDFAEKQFFSLSTGMKQKVALAKALINEPELLFLDEPTLGLDVEVARALRKYVKNLAKTKKATIILTSHYLSEVEELCDNIAIINHGSIIASGTVDEIKGAADIGATITVSFEKEFPKGKISALKNISGVRDAEFRGKEASIYLESNAEPSEKVLAFFRENKINAPDFEVRKSTLEEAFLHLISRKGKKTENEEQ